MQYLADLVLGSFVNPVVLVAAGLATIVLASGLAAQAIDAYERVATEYKSSRESCANPGDAGYLRCYPAQLRGH